MKNPFLDTVLTNYYDQDILGGFPPALIPIISAAITALPSVISAIKGGAILPAKEEKNLNKIYKLIKEYKKYKKANK